MLFNPIRSLENVHKVLKHGIFARSTWWGFAKIKLTDRRNCRERATCNWCHRKYFKKSINEKYLTKHGLANWWSFNIKGHKNDADTYIRLKRRCTIKSQGR